nr:MAG TPA: hypothetical protein [Caudoviricetes sp.]
MSKRENMKRKVVKNWEATKLASRYIRENHINGTVTAYGDHGFEYMTATGSYYFVPYASCRKE